MEINVTGSVNSYFNKTMGYSKDFKSRFSYVNKKNEGNWVIAIKKI